MAKKIEYVVIDSGDYKEFQQQVNKHLDEGWNLHGNLIAFPDPNENSEDVRYIQAMTKDIIEKRKVVMSRSM